jgi:dTDP-4-dehydrorhamnose 3,5-epimerase
MPLDEMTHCEIAIIALQRDFGPSGPKVLHPRIHSDERGFFLESYSEKKYAAAGIRAHFVQDNHSFSLRGVLRGLHFRFPFDEGKLVRVVMGSVYDVVVDLRRESPSFGKWDAVSLDGEKHHQLWVPPGFAHGFCVTSETAHVLYKTTCFYDPQRERVLAWNDPMLSIPWPFLQPILSERDQKALLLSELFAEQVP